uniref:VENN motif pre-toxin domain-containing protein n=1 Tax=Pantoea sp. sgz302252 TaxID=3341827 RepID=UPI0036D209CC
TKSATEALNRAGTKELAAAKTEWQKANPDKTPTQDDIVQQLYQTSYNKAMLDSGKGTGGALQQGISAATAAVSALAGGNLSAAVAGGAAPYLAELIHKATTTKDANGKEVVNVEANLIAHAVLGAAVAQASGGSALAGASGGAAGEYIAQQLYPGVDRKDLSEEQRQTISALGTLAAGLAGGLAGDSAGSAVTGAQAGKNAVENNALSGKDAQEKNSIELALSETGLALHPRTSEEVAALEERHDQLTKLDAEVDKYVQDACSQGRASPACQDANALAQGLQDSYSGYLGRLTYKELNREDYAKVSQIVANTSADKWDYAIEGYAKSQNISYQEAKDKFALAININQAADIAGLLYGLKGSESGKAGISSTAASTMKQVLSKYNDFKQNIASSTKGNNDAMAMAGAGNLNVFSSGKELGTNVNLSTGTRGGKGSPIPVKDPVTASNGLNYQSNPKHTINPPRNAGIEPKTL